MDTDQIGEFLEHRGLTDDEIDAYFEHSGVRGMKWGQQKAQGRVDQANRRSENKPDRAGNRNNQSFQRKTDRVKRVASGTASIPDKIRSVLFDIPSGHIIKEGMSLRGGAQSMLDMNKKYQKKIESGRSHTIDVLNRIGGIDVREIDFG